jgi:predicted nucleic acid-binding protein
MMRIYLFDASAAVDIYVPRNDRVSKAIQFIQVQKRLCKAKLFISNICIAEVFNTFAKRRFRAERQQDVLNEASYKQHLSNFRDQIHWGRTLYTYDLNRYHIIAADKIIPVEHQLAASRGGEYLSTFDILVIAMACELAYTREFEETYLVTCDRRMKDVSDELKVGGARVSTPDGPLGKIEDGRWRPPNCICLLDVKLEELRPVDGQAPLSF